jgi:hypothetical protein
MKRWAPFNRRLPVNQVLHDIVEVVSQRVAILFWRMGTSTRSVASRGSGQFIGSVGSVAMNRFGSVTVMVPVISHT